MNKSTFSVAVQLYEKNKHFRNRMWDKAQKMRFNSLFAIPHNINKNSLCNGKLTMAVEFRHSTEVSNFTFVRRYIKIGKRYRHYYHKH